MNLKPAQRVPALLLFGITSVILFLSLVRLEFLERLENLTYDARVRVATAFESPCATNLAFVYIDESAIRAVKDGSLGYSFGLYWPRQVYGRLVDELHRQGVGAVGFDVIFAELRPDHASVQMADGNFIESDDFFALQLKRASNVVLATTPDVTLPASFESAAAALGDISTDKDPDGVLRRVKVFRTYRQWHPVFIKAEADPDLGIDLRNAQVYPHTIVLKRSGGDDIRIPLDEDGNFALADFIGDNIPPGLTPKAKPFQEKQRWHMGVVLAAADLGLDLNAAEIRSRRIILTGPNAKRTLPVDEHGYFYINWRLPPNSPQLKQQSALSLLQENRDRLSGLNVPTNTWAGSIVVVGSSAMGNDLTDRGATPLRSDTLLASKHWNVANSIITGRFVVRAHLWLEALMIIVLSLAAGVATWKLRALVAFTAVLAAATLWVLTAFAVYAFGQFWLPVVLPVAGALLTTHLTLLTWRVVFEQAERRRVKSIFSKMVSPMIVNELLEAETLSLGGVRRDVTVLFADIRGFTAFTDAGQERASELVRRSNLTGHAAEACFDKQARETLATVNLYIGLIADLVIKHNGTLDKFIGDCVMAFWGAPVSNSRHATDCVRAAVAAQRAIYNLNLERERENRRIEAANQIQPSGTPPEAPLPLLSLGTGIHTGTATVGLMGSAAEICNYTVFGRDVNLASRLEGVSGHGRIVISESTFNQLHRDDPELARTCIALEPVTLKGIRQPVAIYEVRWREDQPQISASA